MLDNASSHRNETIENYFNIFKGVYNKKKIYKKALLHEKLIPKNYK
uniref:Uncharacterized protein n=1 Tax=viral metagenome TaxID=1070528 RepID=A0A6C0HLT3_9ZZZZ